MMKTKNILAVFIALALLSFSVLTVIASQIEDKLTSGMDTSEMTGGAATSPTASPAAGDYSSTQTVTLTATGATTICYTIDGNDATCASSDACEAGASVYTTALSISDDTTINTTACYPENTPSNLASYTYTISASTPPPGGGSGYTPPTTTTTTLPTTTTTTTIPVESACQWCGLACIELQSWMYCPALTPPTGYICTEINDVCTKTIGTTTTTTVGSSGSSGDGGDSALQARIAQLQEMINNLLRKLGLPVITTTTVPGATTTTITTPPVTLTGIPEGFTFKNNLSQNMVSEDIRYLQRFLNSHAGTKVADTGLGSPGQETNYFGALTKAAVIKFQNMYTSEVLAQWGLTKGNGYVGQSTRKKLNELLGQQI